MPLTAGHLPALTCGRDIFTSGQVARLIGVAPRTVAKWMAAGRLAGYRIPGSQDRRFERAEVLRFCRDHGIPHALVALERGYLLGGLRPVLGGAVAAELGGAAVSAGNAFDLGRLLNAHVRCVVLDAGGLGRSAAMEIARRVTAGGQRVVVLATEDDGQWREFNAVAAAVLRQPCGAADVAAAARGEA